jgi:NMD protein affecting ribosome stability and mRNA decay
MESNTIPQTKVCYRCGNEHKNASSFCSQDCFNKWYDLQEVPKLTIEMAIKAIEEGKKRNV